MKRKKFKRKVFLPKKAVTEFYESMQSFESIAIENIKKRIEQEMPNFESIVVANIKKRIEKEL